MYNARFVTLFVLALIFAIALPAQSPAQTKFKYNGVYTAWGQSQHAFTFDHDSYEDNYVVQMFRLNLSFSGSENVKAVTRFDLGQGWWGIDNALRSVQRTGTSGGSALFDFKDTNFLFHVDHAYVQFKLPDKPLTFRVGRMNYSLGNRIMIDNNYDGVQLDIKTGENRKLTLSWAKVSEGGDNLSDLEVVDNAGNTIADNRDANLYIANFSGKTPSLKYNVYGFYFRDASINDMNAYVPDKLQFFKTRFSVQPTKLMSVGVSGEYTAGKFSLIGEFDYLTGKDEIANTTYGAKQMWDINDGNLSGFNLYLKSNYAVSPKFTLGGVFGMGSGDDDLTGGKGNINKLRTSGFFYITEIWEDSIMPDEEGISPQGLGAPNVRGYRELENTTALQVNGSFRPTKKLELFSSFTYLKSTQPVFAWSMVDGMPVIDTATSANDLGTEIDFRISYKIEKGLSAHLRGGFFTPGTAAGYLIRGTDTFTDIAWELKGMVTYKF